MNATATQPRASESSEWRASPRTPVLALSLAGLAVALHLAGAANAVQYDATIRPLAEPWRLVTCHWAHWSANHLAWSGGAFFVLGAACERLSRRRFVAGVAGAAVVVPIVLWVIQPELYLYRGLSGIDSALFVLLAVGLLRAHAQDRAPGWRLWAAATVVALVAFACKILFELTTGATVFIDAAGAGFAPVPLAHATGAAVGAVAGLVPGRTGVAKDTGSRAAAGAATIARR